MKNHALKHFLQLASALCLIGFLYFYSNTVYAGIGPPVQLNGKLRLDSDVFTYGISADGLHVVYSADQDFDKFPELYSVPINGGSATRLSHSPTNRHGVSNFQITPDSNRVVYHSFDRGTTSTVSQLFSVSISGNEAPVALNISSGRIESYQITPDSSHVVALAYQQNQNGIVLQAAPIDGTSPSVILSSAIGQITEVGDYVEPSVTLSLDSLRVFYVGASIDGNYGIQSAPISGEPSINLTADLTGAPHRFYQLKNSKMGGPLIFAGIDRDRRENALYSIPTAGGALTRLSSLGHYLGAFQVSPDGQRVVYLASDIEQQINLYSVLIEDGQTIRLNGTLVSDGDVRSFEVSSDNKRVVYSADKDPDNIVDLFSVPIDGGASVRLNQNLRSDSLDFNFKISDDNRWVVYLAEGHTEDMRELYSISIEGGIPVVLNNDLVSSGNVGYYDIAADSTRVVYRIHNIDNTIELYITPIDELAPRRLNGPLSSGRDLRDFLISEDSEYVIYRANQNTRRQLELFSVHISNHIDEGLFCVALPTHVFCL